MYGKCQVVFPTRWNAMTNETPEERLGHYEAMAAIIDDQIANYSDQIVQLTAERDRLEMEKVFKLKLTSEQERRLDSVEATIERLEAAIERLREGHNVYLGGPLAGLRAMVAMQQRKLAAAV